MVGIHRKEQPAIAPRSLPPAARLFLARLSTAIVLLLMAGRTSSAYAQTAPTWGGAELTGATFAWRQLGSADPQWHQGLELAWGPTLAVDQGPFRFSGLVQFNVRAFDKSSWAIALSTHAFEVAARLGIVEPQIRAGFAFISLDDFRGNLSAEAFSPRVGVGLGVRASRRIRVSVGAYAEYFWRWFGPSVLVRGLALDLRYEKPQRKHQ
jgi:hypothetical protein